MNVLHIEVAMLVAGMLSSLLAYMLGRMHGYRQGYRELPDKEARARAVDASLRKSAARAGKATRKGARVLGFGTVEPLHKGARPATDPGKPPKKP